MNAAEIPFGGGVSPRFTRRLKGQSTIEYVLVIAIIALVVLIAGPWVSSAIRNQFNLVAGAIGNGIDKGGLGNRRRHRRPRTRDRLRRLLRR